MKTDVYHFAGLVYGDFDGEILEKAAQKGKVALDVQCMLRHVEADKTMGFHDWAEKEKYLPMIHYLKTDAAEAEIMTGLQDRAEAARLFHKMGAKEFSSPQYGSPGLRRGEYVYLPHQGEKPFRKDGERRHGVRRLHCCQTGEERGGGPAVLHGSGFPENGDPGSVPGDAAGCAALYARVL